MASSDESLVPARQMALEIAKNAFSQLDINGEGKVDKEALRAIAADFRSETNAAGFDSEMASFFDSSQDGMIQES